MPLKVSNNWLQSYSASKFEVTGHTIINAVTDNPFFLDLDPPLPVLIGHEANYVNAAAAATDGGKAETAAKNAARLVYAESLRQLGTYIDATATTEEQFLSSKYPLRKEGAPIGIQPAPSNMRAKHGKVSGSLDASCDANEHRVLYEWQTAVGQNPTDWTIQPTSNSSRSTFSGFTPGTWVNVRCRVRVPAGAGDWSSVVQLMMI
ncbi:MAG: hypothetical protein V4640_16195 [Verrucomicrobiota bacterium]